MPTSRVDLEYDGRDFAGWSAQPGLRTVQAEVERALARPRDFLDVPAEARHHLRKASGLFRDSEHDERPAFVVQDGNYVSARWPGDVHTFARRFAEVCREAGA